ncbi:hypothetical protein [Aliishimia ponticola]|uniref:hypothetical protein n=1 Tax=Aliishimia ponticola TaxID=2499833 RepID=UPI001FE8D115|nr:hypothetical protein [Aliishimia ponticola]
MAIVAYKDAGPPKLTLITVINNNTGGGGHAALMISGSQRVIFDPAGSFRPDWVAEYGDVLYGITPRNLQAYKSAHARNSHHVVLHELPVSAQTANLALRLVEERGSVPSAFCANSISTILGQLPGLEDIKVTFYPEKLMGQFAAKGAVVVDQYYEDDDGNVVDGYTVAVAE